MEQQKEVLERFIKEFDITDAKIELFKDHHDDDMEKWNEFFNEKGVTRNDDSNYIIFVGNDTSSMQNFTGFKLLKSENNIYIFKKETEESPEKKRKREEAEEAEKKRKIDEGEEKTEAPKEDGIKENVEPEKEKNVEMEKVRAAEHVGETPRTKEEGEKVLHDQ